LRKRDDGKTATIYETEVQLFPEKCEVKLHKHSNHIAGRAETSKTGKTCEADLEQGKVTINPMGRWYITDKNYNEKDFNDFSSLDRLWC
jgi:hypothetical protein